MDILEALKEDAFHLPKHNNKTLFTTFLEETFSNFLIAVNNIDDGSLVEELKPHLGTLEKLCTAIVKSAKTYYNGFPSKAYFEFEEAIELIDDFLFPTTKYSEIIDEHKPYYRARVGSNKLFQIKEMFHIPFELREYVTTQRFSVPGLPCLYLANSVYVCWEELRQPDINKMQVSRFKLINNDLKFLDLSTTPSFLRKMLETMVKPEFLKATGGTVSEQISSWDKMTLSYLMKWPLVAACSIKVRKSDGNFKPEYIFPQFLLQWVTHKKNIDGIQYFSVEATSAANIDHSRFINYVIPIKEFKEEGYCDALMKSFSMTEPVSMEVLSILNPSVLQHDPKKVKDNINKLGIDTIGIELELIKTKPAIYLRTIFGKIELEVADLPFNKIDIPA